MRFPIETDRLSIEPLNEANLKSFVSYRQVSEIARFQSWEPNYSLEQGLKLIQDQAGVNFPGPDEWLQLGLTLKVTGELVGDLAIHNLEADQPTVEIGFTVAKNHQLQGYAKEATVQIISVLKKEKLASKIVARTDSRNVASIRLLKSLGLSEKPELAWTEEFKGETAQVLHFETQLANVDLSN